MTSTTVNQQPTEEVQETEINTSSALSLIMYLVIGFVFILIIGIIIHFIAKAGSFSLKSFKDNVYEPIKVALPNSIFKNDKILYFIITLFFVFVYFAIKIGIL
tara:strand:+ start:235 stop:543 length:309 start_codon:yes stop_codon:yes gene_type:complete